MFINVFVNEFIMFVRFKRFKSVYFCFCFRILSFYIFNHLGRFDQKKKGTLGESAERLDKAKREPKKRVLRSLFRKK